MQRSEACAGLVQGHSDRLARDIQSSGNLRIGEFAEIAQRKDFRLPRRKARDGTSQPLSQFLGLCELIGHLVEWRREFLRQRCGCSPLSQPVEGSTGHSRAQESSPVAQFTPRIKPKCLQQRFLHRIFCILRVPQNAPSGLERHRPMFTDVCGPVRQFPAPPRGKSSPDQLYDAHPGAKLPRRGEKSLRIVEFQFAPRRAAQAEVCEVLTDPNHSAIERILVDPAESAADQQEVFPLEAT